MSAPVDVLADLHEMYVHASFERQWRSDASQLAAKGEYALAAVAELIEADREYDEASKAWGDIPGPGDGEVDDRDYLGDEWQRVLSAERRRAAALARCTGAQP